MITFQMMTGHGNTLPITKHDTIFAFGDDNSHFTENKVTSVDILSIGI